ncbi:MAG: glycosyltransferase family 4 protein [Sandaracinaceae bacterium]
MPRVLFVSKPVVPPWNDSSKNLAFTLASRLTRVDVTVMTDGTDPGLPSRVRRRPVYASPGRFSPAGRAQLAVLRELAAGPPMDLWHFFFAPNPRTSTVARSLAAVRRTRAVHTICSRPLAMRSVPRLLFAERNVVLSRATFDAILDAGVPRERVARIAPAVPPLPAPTEDARAAARARFDLSAGAPLVVYPGDLEVGGGATLCVDALAALDRSDAILVVACRAKTDRAREAERALRARAAPLGERVRFIGETPHIHALLGAADVVALPSVDLYAKMDLPLVLLEAMWLARPVVVAARSVAAELADGGAAIACGADRDALADAFARLLNDDGARIEQGARARAAAAERFDPDAMARAYESIYQELLGS